MLTFSTVCFRRSFLHACLQAIGKDFTRPHTLIGTVISITTVARQHPSA